MDEQTLPSLLESAAASGGMVHFVDGRESMPFGDLWNAARGIGAGLSSYAADGAIGMFLESTPECLVALLGGIRAGLRIVSLPAPPRGSNVEWYATYARHVCDQADISTLLVPDGIVSLVPDIGTSVRSYNALEPSLKSGTPGRSFEFVQFTSGSTSAPRGIVLTDAEISAGIAATLDRLQPSAGDKVASWLPWSHDMGLMGMALSTFVGFGEAWANGGEAHFLSPQAFLRAPWAWIRLCSEVGATITAAPDFALRMLTDLVQRVGPVELSRLRAVIVGAEPIHSSTLEGFEGAYTPFGFERSSLCPAYGLAEAGLAVSLTPPGAGWHDLYVPIDHGVHDAEPGFGGQGRRVVSCGKPLDGIRVSIAIGDQDRGMIEIDGPSTSRRYLGDSQNRTGPFPTMDSGLLKDSNLYVLGRVDDVVNVAGRKVHLSDVDVAVEGTDVVAPGRSIGFLDDVGELCVAVEARAGEVRRSDADEIKRLVMARVGVRPVRVYLFEKGALPRTTSGKPRRSHVRRAASAGAVARALA